MHGRITLALALLLLPLALLGCREGAAKPREAIPAGPNAELASAFRKEATGAIDGRVTWHGDPPQVEAFSFRNEEKKCAESFANPNSPSIDRKTLAVRNALVFLRGVDAKRARPWDHGPVRGVVQDRRFEIFQGTRPARYGIVRQGETMALLNWDLCPHQVRVRGASFFTLPLVDADSATRRSMTEKGVVELSSGAGYFWMHAHLFVDDHPYYATTDEQGRFTVPQTPEGSYRLVCWMPNWRVARKDRDQESILVVSVAYAKAMEKEQTLEVRAGRSTTVDFSVGADDFLEGTP